MTLNRNDTELYRKLLLARLSEEAIRDHYASDEMKTPVHLGIGAEAIAVGVSHCLATDTEYFATYRNHNLYLALSEDTDQFFAELFGRVTGVAKGKAGSMHLSYPERGLILTSAVVGTTIPVAVGAAFANRYKAQFCGTGKSEASFRPVVAFFGDGAMEEGVFWESLNFARLHRLPVLFVCEDNELAIHSHRAERQSFKSVPEIMSGFGCYFGSCVGFDLDKVIAATDKVLEQMKAEPGPGFLHCSYFRFLEHVGPQEDFAAGYRAKPDRAEQVFDPIQIYEKAMLDRGVAQAQLEEVRANLTRKIQGSIEKARKAGFAGPDEILRDVYVEEEMA